MYFAFLVSFCFHNLQYYSPLLQAQRLLSNVSSLEVVILLVFAAPVFTIRNLMLAKAQLWFHHKAVIDLNRDEIWYST